MAPRIRSVALGATEKMAAVPRLTHEVPISQPHSRGPRRSRERISSAELRWVAGKYR